MNTVEEQVVLVNEYDEVLGSVGKMQAHVDGLLHRAFSIFLFDGQGRLLLQRRAVSKYHSAGLWTNTCCGHPRPGENIQDAARRRLMEEMGIDTLLDHRFSFLYRSSFENGLHEHELDHVLFGSWSGPVIPNPDEADDWKYMRPEDLDADMRHRPDRYTVWLQACWDQVRAHLMHAKVRP